MHVASQKAGVTCRSKVRFRWTQNSRLPAPSTPSARSFTGEGPEVPQGGLDAFTATAAAGNLPEGRENSAEKLPLIPVRVSPPFPGVVIAGRSPTPPPSHL